MRQGQRREREAGETPPRPIRPNPAILKQHAIVTADAQGLRQRDKEKVIQFATVSIYYCIYSSIKLSWWYFMAVRHIQDVDQSLCSRIGHQRQGQLK